MTNLWWNKSTNLDGVCPSYFSGLGCFSERRQATNEIIVLRSPLCDVMVAGSHLLRRTWRLKSKHGGPSCLDITANYPLGLNASRQKPFFFSSSALRMSRIFAISDIHVDIPENLRLVNSWSDVDFKNDVLILAGDVTDNLSLLKTVLTSLTQKFSKVCYVPGLCTWVNHY